jgi:hypothetical protein
MKWQKRSEACAMSGVSKISEDLTNYGISCHPETGAFGESPIYKRIGRLTQSGAWQRRSDDAKRKGLVELRRMIDESLD